MAGLYYFLPYFAPLMLVAAERDYSPAQRRLLWAICLIFLVSFVGLRSEVGADWVSYSMWVDDARNLSLAKALLLTDPAYALLNWLGAQGTGGIYFVNFVCSLLAISSLLYFCSKQDSSALALTMAIPYLIVVVFMGYTRQSVAIGFGFLAMVAVQERNARNFIVWITIAALFHRSAVVLLALFPALYLPSLSQKDVLRCIGILLYGVALAALLFRDSATVLIQHYLISTGDNWLSGPQPRLAGEATGPNSGGEVNLPTATGLSSAGAAIRLSQSVAAVAVFFFIASRMKLPSPVFWLWTLVSALVVTLFVLSFWRSTLADRIGLFFLGIQLFAFSTLPSVLPPVWSTVARCCVVFASVASLWVWLNFGHHADSWLPYKNVLLP